MNILILNGSPKGKYSITLHTCLYIEKMFPEHEYTVLNVGQQIRKYEKDLSGALAALKKADLILFSYPVYTFIVPSQLHRFLELVKESGIDLSGKFATQISTSKHFYDVTAHRFVQDNCADLGLKQGSIGGYGRSDQGTGAERCQSLLSLCAALYGNGSL